MALAPFPLRRPSERVVATPVTKNAGGLSGCVIALDIDRSPQSRIVKPPLCCTGDFFIFIIITSCSDVQGCNLPLGIADTF